MSHLSNILNLIAVGIAVLLMIAILTQNTGSGLSTVFGGGGAVYRTKRGFEKWLFYGTIVLAILFVLLSVASVLATKF